jgi:hypothetical protein
VIDSGIGRPIDVKIDVDVINGDDDVELRGCGIDDDSIDVVVDNAVADCGDEDEDDDDESADGCNCRFV